MSRTQETDTDVVAARAKWLDASERASKLAADLFQPGDGYGNPDARAADEHRLQSARHEAERLFREYYDVDRRDTDEKMPIYSVPSTSRLGRHLPSPQWWAWLPLSAPLLR